MTLRHHFTDHPSSVGETYGEHFRVAAGFAAHLALAAGAAAVHAVIPSLCETSASRRITMLHDRMAARRVETPTDALDDAAVSAA